MLIRRSFLWRVLLISAALVCLGLGSFTALRIAIGIREAQGAAKFREAVVSLKNEGYPVSDADLQAIYKNATEETYTNEWQRLFREVSDPSFVKSSEGVYLFDRNLGIVKEPEFSADGTWVLELRTSEFLLQHVEIIRKVHELASHRVPVRFPIRFDSYNTSLEHDSHLRTVAKLICLEGYAAIRNQNSVQLEQDIETLFNVSEVIDQEPFTIADLVQIAIEEMGLELLKIGLENGCVEYDKSSRIVKRLEEQAEVGKKFAFMIENERALGVEIFLNPARGRRGNSTKQLPTRGWDGLHYFEVFDSALQMDTSTLDNLLDASDKIEAHLKAKTTQSVLTAQDWTMTGLLTPSFFGISSPIVRHSTRCRLAAYAIAATLHAKSTGAPPATLEELDLAHECLQPPGGKPFGYRVLNDHEFIIWGPPLPTKRITPDEIPAVSQATPHYDNYLDMIWKCRTTKP